MYPFIATHMGGTEQTYIAQAFQDNWIAPAGPHIDLFENRLVDFLDQKRSGCGFELWNSSDSFGIAIAWCTKKVMLFCVKV